MILFSLNRGPVNIVFFILLFFGVSGKSNAQVTIADAGSDTVICTSSYTLTANIADADETGSWTYEPSWAPLVFSSFNDPNATVSELTPGTVYTFTWTISDGTESNSDTVTIHYRIPTQADAGNDQCLILPENSSSLSSKLNGNAINSFEKSSWTLVSSPTASAGSIAAPTLQESDINDLGAGAHIFQYSVIDESSQCYTEDITQITITKKATVSDHLCVGITGSDTTLMIQGTSPGAGETVTWEVNPLSPALISDNSSATTSVSNLTKGVHIVTFKISNSGCTDSAEVEIAIVSKASAPENICTSEGQPVLLTADLPADGEKGQWTSTANINFTSPASPSTSAQGFYAGTTEVTWTISDSSGSCSISDSFLVTAVTKAQAGEDICTIIPAASAEISTTLNGNFPTANESSYWYSLEGDSLIGNGTIETISLSAGIHHFIYNIRNIDTNCKTADTVKIIAISESVAGPDQCLSEPVSLVNLEASPVKPGETGTWNLRNGILLISSLSDPNATVNHPASGSYILDWEVENSGCKSSSSTRLAIISKPEAGENICLSYTGINTKTNLASTPVNLSYQTAQWTVKEGTGTFTAPSTANTTVTGISKGKNIYYWSITDSTGFCTKKDSITVSAVTVPYAGFDRCISSSTEKTPVTLTGNKPGNFENGFWTNKDSINTRFSSTQVTSLTLGKGIHYFYWNIENTETGCIKRDSVKITIISQPDPGADICFSGNSGSIQLSANTLASGETGTWTSNPALNFSSPNNSETTVINPANGVYKVWWKIENEGCKDSSDVILSVISESNAGNDQCLPHSGAGTKVLLDANAVEPFETGTWSIDEGSGAFQNVNLPNSEIIGLSLGVNKFIWTVKDSTGFCTSTDTTWVTTVSPAEAGTDQCTKIETSTRSITLDGSHFNSILENGFWNSPDSLEIKISSNTQTTLNLRPGVHKFYWNIQNKITGCFQRDSVVVKVLSKPDAGTDQCLTEPVAYVNLNAKAAKSSIGESAYWKPHEGLNFSSVSNPSATISGPSSGAYRLWWVLQNQGCKDSAEVKISIISSAKTMADFCLTGNGNSTSFTVSAENFDNKYQHGNWSARNIATTFSHRDSVVSTVFSPNHGVNTVFWTISDTIGFCKSVDSLKVTVISPARIETDTCNSLSNSSDHMVKLNGSTFSGIEESGQWSSHPSVVISNATTTQASASVPAGVYKFFWTIKNNLSGCTVQDSSKVVVLSSASIREPEVLCVAGVEDPVYLTADTVKSSIGETGTWSEILFPQTQPLTFNSVHTPVTEVGNLSQGFHWVKWSVENSGCTGSDSIRLSIVSRSKPEKDICTAHKGDVNTLITLRANEISQESETGLWTISPASNSFNIAVIEHPEANITKVTGLKKGVHTFYFTIKDSLNICKSVDSLNAAVITPPNAGTNQCRTINLPDTSIVIALKGNTFDNSTETGLWRVNKVSTISNAGSPNASATISHGVYNFYWTIRNKNLLNCELSDTILVTAISKSRAGDQQCLNTPSVTTDLRANSLHQQSGETGRWYNLTDSTITNFSSRSSPNSSISGLRTGVHRLKWEISNAGCKDSSFVNIVLVTKPDAGPNQCLPYTGGNTKAILNAAPITIADSAMWLPGNDAVTGVSLNPAGVNCEVTAFSPGAYSILWIIKDTAKLCTFTDTTIVSVVTQPDIPTALCEIIPKGEIAKNVNITANKVFNNETGTWRTTPNLTITDKNNPSGQFENIQAGKYRIFWEIKNNKDTTCIKTDSTILRVISKSDAGPNTCIIKPVENTILNANPAKTASGEAGRWKLVTPPGQIQFDQTNPKSTVIRLPIGVSVFRWFIEMDQKACSDSSDVKISVQTKSIAENDKAICGTDIQVQGNQFASPAEIGYWSVIPPSTAQLQDSLQTLGTVSNLKPGPNILLWTISNEICENSDTIVVINNQPTEISINTTDQQNTCYTVNQIIGNDPKEEIITSSSIWAILEEPALNNKKVTFEKPASASTYARGMNAAGTYKFIYKIYNSTCDTIRDTITFYRNASLDNYAFAPEEACVTDTVRLTGKPAPEDGEGIWRIQQGFAEFSDFTDPNATAFNLGEGQNNIVWELTRGECRNTQNIKVTGYENPSPVTIYSSDQQICHTDTLTLRAALPAVGTGKWSVVAGSAKILNPDAPITKVEELSYGVNIFRYTISNGPCKSQTGMVTIERFQQPTLANAGKDTNVCVDQFVLNATPVSVGSGIWNVLKGGATIQSPLASNSLVYNLGIGENLFGWEIINGICKSRDSILVVYHEPVDTAKTGDDFEICDEDHIILSANSPVKGSGEWICLDNSVELETKTSSSTRTGILPVGTTTFIWKIKKGYCESSDTIKVTKFGKTATALAGPDQEIFSGSFYLNAEPIDNGQGVWSTPTGSGIISDTASPFTLVSNVPFGESYYIWTVKNGICEPSIDTLTVLRREFDLPNAFSPNGDQKNSYFEIKGIDQFSPAEFTVFNRWGEQVYYSADYKNHWDGRNSNGKELVDDTYYYLLKLNNGTKYQGFVVLKR